MTSFIFVFVVVIAIVCFLLYFWPCMACRRLVPQLETEPAPLAVRAQSPNHWATREFPFICLHNRYLYLAIIYLPGISHLLFHCLISSFTVI